MCWQGFVKKRVFFAGIISKYPLFWGFKHIEPLFRRGYHVILPSRGYVFVRVPFGDLGETG